MGNLATLKPFVPGFDPRRAKGGGRPSIKAKIKKFIDTSGGSFEGSKITKEELQVLMLIRDSTDKDLPAADRHRAAKILQDRLYGKPKESVTMKGNILHTTVVGKELSVMETEELQAAKRAIVSGTHRIEDGRLVAVIIEAEFADENVSHADSENGKSESE